MSCIFCNINKDNIILENEDWVSIYDGYPVSPGHMLIISKKHTNDIFDILYLNNSVTYIDILSQTLDYIYDNYHPDGINIGINLGEAAGQTIPHLHIHVIPRYNGDVEDPCGGVRGVIPDKQKYKN